MPASPNPRTLVFVAYTALGYLALLIHQGLFVPGMAAGRGPLHSWLALANLAAGTWCFLRALFSAWSPGRA